ncbi:MAG: LysR substrate-binding domain-containing protein [Verrucomicrobia subdivision 3 bacterium]|nr:LysR substrate-binding domain-containing protein [Limisphaerales bacterium]
MPKNIFGPLGYDGRNRTFFFFSYEGVRLRTPFVTVPLQVPSIAARQSATGVLRDILNSFPLPTGAAFANAPNAAPYQAAFSKPSSLDAASFRVDQNFGSRHVSQPTLSQQVRELEAELGVPLFDRIGKQVRLTAAGEIFREHAQRATKEIQEARVAIGELEGLKRGEVTVGVVQTVNTYLIPGVVARFSAAYPAIRLEVRELASGQIEAGIVAGNLNLGVGFVPPGNEKIVAERLFDEELVLVVPLGHQLADRKRVRVRELHGERLSMLSQAYCTRRLADEALRAGGAQPRITVEMNAIDGILATVREGGVATVLPALAAQGVRAYEQ